MLGLKDLYTLFKNVCTIVKRGKVGILKCYIKGQHFGASLIIILYNNLSGLEQVHDAVEQSLLKEVATLRECQDKFRNMLEKVKLEALRKFLCTWYLSVFE